MLVRNNALIGEFTNPYNILAHIPCAKFITFKKHNLVVVPHRLDETHVLRNLGVPAPSPILTQYNWTGKFTPMQHQKDSAAFFTLNKRCFNLSEMRTGKTSSALWAIDYLLNIGAIDEVLVICPLSVVDVWVNEGFGTMPHRAIQSMVGPRSKRLAILDSKSNIKVTNFDGVVTLKMELAEKYADKRVVIIVDECATYRTVTQRYKALKSLITPKTWLWMMTGTPTPNAPTDAWAQAKLVNPKAVPASFKLYQETLMRPAGPYKWVPKPGAADLAFKALQPAIRFLRRDVLNPETVQMFDRKCELSAEQKIAYENFKKKMRHDDKEAGIEITAANAAVRLLKMQQVFCGVVRDDAGAPVMLDNKSRLNLVEEIIEESGGKAIVFAPFKFTMAQLNEHLGKRWSTEIVNGNTPKGARTDIFQRFQNDELNILVAHPATTAHGLDLSASSTVIWFAPTFSMEQYDQANARPLGPNQKEAVGIFHIGCHPVEWAIYEALQNKARMQNALLALYESLIAE